MERFVIPGPAPLAGSEEVQNCDVLVAGGGPAGSSCAAFCARGGLRVSVIERAIFPRDKVCGDCLNPDCWPVLDRLGAAEAVRALECIDLRQIEFISDKGRRVRFPMPSSVQEEVTVKRAELDACLLAHAGRCGANISHGQAVSGLTAEGPAWAGEKSAPGFTASLASGERLRARFVVAADGRNSLIARLAGLLPPGSPAARVGLQTHAPAECCPAEFSHAHLVRMQWFPGGGYGGFAPVGGGELNLSIAASPGRLRELREWAAREFRLPADQAWQTIAPIDRAPARLPATDTGIFLVGDAARVVEPFTGEGIYYALRSGEAAAAAVLEIASGRQSTASAARRYARVHRAIYRERGRLWVNRLARAAVLHPRLAAWALELLRWRPGMLRFLTAKIVRA